jgi:hypothetical protein
MLYIGSGVYLAVRGGLKHRRAHGRILIDAFDNCKNKGLGFRVWGLGFRILIDAFDNCAGRFLSGFTIVLDAFGVCFRRFWDSESRIEGLGFRVWEHSVHRA